MSCNSEYSRSLIAVVNHFVTVFFWFLGAFEEGLAKGKIDTRLQPIRALRLVVQSDAEVWAVLSEVGHQSTWLLFSHLQ